MVADDSGTAIGVVTSVTDGFALGYMRSKSKGQQVLLEGRKARLKSTPACMADLSAAYDMTARLVGQVLVAGRPAEVVDIPMATRTVLEAPLVGTVTVS